MGSSQRLLSIVSLSFLNPRILDTMAFSNFLKNSLSLGLIVITIRSFPVLFEWFSMLIVVFCLIRLFDALRRIQRRYLFHKKLDSTNKAILITGCDSGFGHLLAQHLYDLGYHVFAGCLSPSGEGAKDLKTRTSLNFQILELDVTDDKSVAKALEFVKQNLKTNEVLWAVVNNAGVGTAGEVEWTPMEEIINIFDVNTIGIIRVTKAFLPLLRKSKGRVVNHTSLCGHLTSPGYVAYCMSKTAAVSFTTGLRMEMKKWGVEVISIEPFFYRSPMTGIERNLETVENIFNRAPQSTKEAYGETYLNAFKQSCAKLLARSSPNINEVIECFEDSITAEEPEPNYFPCYLPHKIILKLRKLLPQSTLEIIQLSQMPRFVKPAALCQ